MTTTYDVNNLNALATSYFVGILKYIRWYNNYI